MDYNIILGKSILTNTSDAYSGTLNVSYSQYTNNGVYLCQVDTTNTTISPTLSLNGLTTYPIKRNDGTSVSIGELQANAWYLFMFDGTTSVFEILNLSIPYFNGTTNYVAKYTPTGNVLGISQIFDNGTNVGIGTITPTAKLHIKGTDSTSSNYSLKIDNSASSPLLYVRNDGNVGVGTSTPTEKLEVNNGNIKTNQGVIVDGGTYFGLRFNSSGNSRFAIDNVYKLNAAFIQGFKFTNGVYDFFNYDQSNFGDTFQIGNGLIKGRTTGITDIYFGINVSGTPSSTLHVVGTDSTSSNYSLKIDNLANNPLFYVRNDGVILANNLPTSSAGLPSGAIWNNSGVLNIV